MITWQQWVEGPQDFPREWETLLNSEAGRKGMEVLASRLMQDVKGYNGGNIIELKAMTGAEDDGYRKCFRYINELRLSVTEPTKKQWDTHRAAGQLPSELQNSQLLGANRAAQKITEDPIYAERERRQKETTRPPSPVQQ